MALAFGGASAALATPGGNAQHVANSIGSHGKSPRHEAPPDIAHGRLPAPSTIRPVVARSFAAARKRGSVSYRAGGPNAPGPPTPLISDASLPFGVAIDASHGTAILTLAENRAGRRQVIALTGGAFVVREHGRHPVTDIVLTGGNFTGCPSARGAAVAARHRSRRRSRHSVVRRLWARDDHGRFSSYGANSVATVRGTIWLTEDRCDGTLTRVVRGRVAVFDERLRHTVVVSAGHSYLARTR